MDAPPGLDYNSYRRWRTSQGIRGTRRDLTAAWRVYSTLVPPTGTRKASAGRKGSASRHASPERLPSPVSSPREESPPRLKTPKSVVAPKGDAVGDTRPFPVEHVKEYQILTSAEGVDVSSLLSQDVRGRLLKLVPYAAGRLLGTPTLASVGRTSYTRLWVFVRDGHLLALSDYKQTTATLAAVRGVLPTPEEFWESGDEWTFLLAPE
jgi:hypothetical protein